MTGRGRGRPGFSTIEMVVVCLMTTLLSMILAAVWSGFCRPARDAATRCRLATEANLAVFALAQDLAGNLVDVQAAPDTSPNAGAGQVCLRLTYEYPDSVITYRLDGDRLLRDGPGGVVTLAGELLPFSADGSGFDLAPWPDDAGQTGVSITLTFASREANARYSARDPDGTPVPRVLSLVYKVVALKPKST